MNTEFNKITTTLEIENKMLDEKIELVCYSLLGFFMYFYTFI